MPANLNGPLFKGNEKMYYDSIRNFIRHVMTTPVKMSASDTEFLDLNDVTIELKLNDDEQDVRDSPESAMGETDRLVFGDCDRPRA